MKYRIWDENQKTMDFIDIMDFESSSSKLQYYDEYFLHGYLEKFKPMISLNIKDSEGVNLWEGDLRMYKGKMYEVEFSGWRATLRRTMYQFRDNDEIVIDEDVAYLSSLIGDIYQNSNLLLHPEKFHPEKILI